MPDPLNVFLDFCKNNVPKWLYYLILSAVIIFALLYIYLFLKYDFNCTC